MKKKRKYFKENKENRGTVIKQAIMKNNDGVMEKNKERYNKY